MRLFSRSRSQDDLPERRRTEVQRRAAEVSETAAGSSTFRRGRTLTGSASPHVRSSSELTADLKSPRVHAHILVKKRRRLGGVFLLTLAVLAALFILMSQFTAQATVQASPDTSQALSAEYVKTITSYLNDHPIERWRSFTNTIQLTAYVRAMLPEVKTVTQQGPAGFGKTLFILTFREPIASWDIGSRQLYVDAEGVPFSHNYFSPPSLHVTDQSGVTTTPGQSIASNQFISFIGQVIGLSKAQGYTVTDIIIPPGMTRQVDVKVQGVSYLFKFSSDRPAGEGVEDMVNVIKWMTAKQITPEYVDIRIAGKAYYK